MLKALAIKELRESAAIIGVAVLAMLYTLGYETGWQFTPWSSSERVSVRIPFIVTEFVMYLVFVGGATAILLGLKQTVWENFGNRYHYLLHRPIARKSILHTKIFVGVVTLGLLMVIPTLLYGWWAATPGNHATPFFWGMTIYAWQACLTIPTIYLGAVLSGIRPAKWHGTRLLPLIGAFLFTFLATGIWLSLGWQFGLATIIVLNGLLLMLIQTVAKHRDY